MAKDDIGSSKLLVGIMTQADISSNIMNVLNWTDDLKNSAIQLKYAKDFVAASLSDLQFLNKKCTQDGYTNIRQGISEVQSYLPTMLDLINYTAGAGKQGWNLTAAMCNERTKLFAQSNLLDMNAHILWEMPESIVKTKAMEWYLSAFRPAEPTEQLAVQQYIRGNITAAKCAQFLAIKGVPDDMAMMIYDTFENYPNIREMAIASQFTPISDEELQANFKYSNITLQKNKDFFIKYAHSLQLRTEFNQYMSLLRQDYVDGLLDRTTLQEEIAEHKPNPAEQAQILENCDTAYNRALLRAEIEAETWLYRKGIYFALGQAEEPPIDAQEYFFEQLLLQGVEEGMCNAIVRLEASKLGINWERD